eukprot:350108-Chlamydomonas_euryale.AAC.4
MERGLDHATQSQQPFSKQQYSITDSSGIPATCPRRVCRAALRICIGWGASTAVHIRAVGRMACSITKPYSDSWTGKKNPFLDYSLDFISAAYLPPVLSFTLFTPHTLSVILHATRSRQACCTITSNGDVRVRRLRELTLSGHVASTARRGESGCRRGE